MNPITIDFNLSDYTLICKKSKCSTYFFKKCLVAFEDELLPFSAVTIQFYPNRLTRRPLVAMLKDLVQCIVEDDADSQQIAEIIYLFLFHLG